MGTKAGALLQSLILNHALIDGNNRLGWVTGTPRAVYHRAAVIAVRRPRPEVRADRVLYWSDGRPWAWSGMIWGLCRLA